MSEQFNPRQRASFAEIPEEHKSHFAALEDGKGFVLKTVEKDPEISFRMAVMEDRAIGLLKEEIISKDLKMDGALSAYAEVARGFDYKKRNELVEQIRTLCDYEILHGKTVDPRVEEVFKKTYVSPSYAQATMLAMIELTEPDDVDVITRLLRDGRFSSKTQLLGKVTEESDLRRIFEATKDDPDIGTVFMYVTKDTSLMLEFYRALTPEARVTNGGHVALKLIGEGALDDLSALMREGMMDGKVLCRQANAIESDELLALAARSCAKPADAIRIMKFIADKDILEKMAEDGAGEVAKCAALVLKAKAQDPHIEQAAALSDRANKFIVGIPDDGERVYISWSDTESHEYHKDIFRTMSRNTGKKFPDALRSGGYVAFMEEEDKISLTFNQSSGDFGCYDHRLLEKYKTQLAEALKKFIKTEKKLEVTIEVSQ